MNTELDDLDNIGYAEELWQRYRQNREAVPPEWRAYFEALEQPEPVDLTRGRQQLHQGFGPGGKVCAGCGRAEAMSFLQYNVSLLVRNYRVRGHLLAKVNPLGNPRTSLPELTPSYYGITDDDLGLLFNFSRISGDGALPLREIIEILQETYTSHIGVQFMHIDALNEREWLQQRMELSRNTIRLSRRQQIRIIERLTDAVIFEQFIQKKFVGAKSFSLEGAETLIPLLDQAIEKAAAQGVDNIVIGMPHRGRLNVLANIMGKHTATIFSEFQDADAELNIGRGDVKYHKGYHRIWSTDDGRKVILDLSFNPSHLEYVGPVAQGALKARQVKQGFDTPRKGLLILIHGDAAMAGEGIVQETLNMSGLAGFSVGGTLHIVVNNQIGFTTLPSEGRSTTYASDVAKMLQSPIFHVNGEIPDAVAQCLDLALDFRKEFQRDVVLDMYCYRRRGHNEGDEPRFTQPLMYRQIDRRPTVMKRYTAHLVSLGELTREEAEAIRRSREQFLEEEYSKLVADRESAVKRAGLFMPAHGPYVGGADDQVPEVETGVSAETLRRLGETVTTVPEGFQVNPKIARLLETRRKMCEGDQPLDWGGGGGSGLCHPARRAGAGAALRSGQPAGNLQPSPQRPPRHGNRRPLHPAGPYRQVPGPHRPDQQSADRGGGAGLRVRLRHRLPRVPGDLGGPVRRFRQRRPGLYRPVHRLGRDQMEPALRAGAAPAPRPGGHRARTRQRPPRALPGQCRHRQLPGGLAH